MSSFFSSYRRVEYILNGNKVTANFDTLLDMDLYVYQLISIHGDKIRQLVAYNINDTEKTAICKTAPSVSRWLKLAPNIMND